MKQRGVNEVLRAFVAPSKYNLRGFPTKCSIILEFPIPQMWFFGIRYHQISTVLIRNSAFSADNIWRCLRRTSRTCFSSSHGPFFASWAAPRAALWCAKGRRWRRRCWGAWRMARWWKNGNGWRNASVARESLSCCRWIFCVFGCSLPLNDIVFGCFFLFKCLILFDGWWFINGVFEVCFLSSLLFFCGRILASKDTNSYRGMDHKVRIKGSVCFPQRSGPCGESKLTRPGNDCYVQL